MTLQTTSLSFIRGDTITYTFSNLDLQNFAKAYFTIKKKHKDNDSDAIIMVDSDNGLYILNGQRISSGIGATLVSSGSIINEIYLTIDASKSYQLPTSIDSNDVFYYDLQVITTGSVVTTYYLGEVLISKDITKRTT